MGQTRMASDEMINPIGHPVEVTKTRGKGAEGWT